MLSIIVVATLVEMTSALVCTPMLCEEMTEQPALNCQGGIIKNGGFCGCTDACAKVEGEVCQAEFYHGIIPAGTCDLGLHCQQQDHMAFGRGVCVKSAPDVDLGLHRAAVVRETVKRARTLCEERRLAGLMTMVMWAGKWIAKCDAEGNFLPEQCDVSGHCFCVMQDGTVIAGTKVLGTADCSSVQLLTTTSPADTASPAADLSPAVRQLSAHVNTKCQQMRLDSMISMVVWARKWTPTCDAQGNFDIRQCYFSGMCFCVTPDGTKIEGSEGHSDCSSYLQLPAASDAPVLSTEAQTLCQRTRIMSLISQVYYEGKWFAECDTQGNFKPQQCDNTGHCFCVNSAGDVVDGTRVLGPASCTVAST